MPIYILKRILAVIPILACVTFFVFSIVYLIPGDPALSILGQAATPEGLQALRKELGLDQPFFKQYLFWLTHLLNGDLGKSIIMHIPVADVILLKFKNTLILTLGSLIISIFLGVLLGIIAGLKPGSLFDRITMFFAQVGANVPVFWLGIILMWFFSLKLGWLPSSGMYDLRNEGDIFSLLKHLILPAIAAASASLSIVARLTRSSVIDVMKAEYITTFRSLGFSNRIIITRHLFRNILSPIINITGLQIGYLIGGVLFVETVFAWPGIGTQLYDSITAKDIPMIQAGVLFIAVSFVFINLFTDIIVGLLNPRLRG